MNYKRCKICGEFGWENSHKCPPIWEVNFPSYDEDHWFNYHAIDANSAATLAAEEYDIEYHPLLNGEIIEAIVRKRGETKTVKFTCSGETVAKYRAVELT